MSSNTNIETNIVQMKFDNAQFEKNCKETMSTLDKLKEKLHSTKSASGLSDLGEAAKGLGLDAVDRSLTSINKKMSILGIAGATVISELTKSAMNFAKTVTTAVPNIIKQGGWTRAMNIEKAKFQLEGLGIAWSQVGEQVSNAVSGTAYSMDSAAKAASQLAASGVEISGVGDQMERSLKAISGVAAQTNSSYDDIANIFTTIAGNGRLMGDQLRQLSARGMNAAAALGKAMGVTEEEIRDMVSKGQISFETFSEIMFQTFGENAFKANQTFEGSLDNMKAALKRTGEAFAGPVIRQTIPVFNALRESINKANKEVLKFSVNNVAEQSKYTDAIASAKSDLEKLTAAYDRGEISLEDYRKQSKELRHTISDLEQEFEDCLGPFEKIAKTVQERIVGVIQKIDFKFVENVMNGFVNILKAGWSILKPFGQAFLEVFGINTKNLNRNIKEMANNFEKFTSKLILSEEEMVYLKRAFKGIISVLSMGSYLIKTVIAALLGVNVNTINLRKSLLKIIGTIGSILYYITDTIKRTNIISAIIHGISTAVYALVGALAFMVSKIIDVFDYIRQTKAFQIVLLGLQKALVLVVGSVVLLAQKIAYIFAELRKGNISVLGPIATVITFVKNGILLLVGAVATLIEKVSHIRIVEDIVNKITAAFEKLQDTLAGLFGKKKGSGSVTIIDEEVPKGMLEVADSVEKASGAAKEAGTNFGFFSNILADFQENMNLSRIASMLFVAAILVVAYKTADALQGIGKGVKGIGSFLGKFAKKGLVGMILGTGDKTPNKILDTAIALGVLALALVGIAKLPADKLKQASEAVTSLMLGFTGMMAVMTYLDQVTGTLGGLANITDAMLGMTLAIAGLSYAMSIFANMDGSIYKGIIGIVACSADLVVMAGLLSKFAPQFKTAAGSLIGLAMSLRLMAGTFKIIVAMKDDVQGVYSVIIAFAVFTGLLVSIASLALRIGNNSSFLRLSLSILALSGAMFLISKVLQKVNIQRMSNILDKWSAFFKNNYLYFLGIVVVSVAATVAAFKAIGLVPKLFDDVIEKIRGTLRKTRSVGDEVKRTVDYLGMGINKLGVAAIILSATAAIVALTVLFFAVAKLSKSLTPEEIKTARYILGDLVGMVVVLSLVAKATEKAKPTALLASILAIAAILGSIMAISLMVSGDLPGTLAGVAGTVAIMLAWMGMMKLMSMIQYDESSYKGIVASIAGIGVIVWSIRQLAQTYNTYGLESYVAAIAGLGALMLAMGGLLYIVGRKGMVISAQKRQALLEIIAAVGAISLGIMGIMWVSNGDYEAIKTSAKALAGVITIFGGIAVAMGTIKWDPNTWKAFAGIAATAVAIGGILIGMVAVIGNKYDQITAAVMALTGTAFLFVGMAKVLDGLSKASEAMVVMIGLSVSALIFGATLMAMTRIIGDRYTEMWSAVGGLVVVASLFTGIAMLLGKFEQSLLGMVVLKALALSALEFAGSIALLTLFDTDAMWESVKVLIAVAGALSVFAGLLGALGEFSIVGAAVLVTLAGASITFSVAASILAVSLGLLLPVISTFVNDIMATMVQYKDDYLAIGLTLVSLAAGLTALGYSGLVLGAGALGLTAGSIAVGLLSLALKSLGEVPFAALSTGLASLLLPLLEFGVVSAILSVLSPAIITTAAALYIYAAAVESASQKITANTMRELSKMPVEAYKVGLFTVAGVTKGLVDARALGALVKTTAMVSQTVIDTMRKVLGIHSPSTEGFYNGLMTTVGYGEGLLDKDTWNLINSTMEGDLTALVGNMDMSDSSGKAGGDTGKAFVQAATREIDSGVTIIDMLLYKIKQKFEQAKAWMKQINQWADEAEAEDKRTVSEKNAGVYRGVSGPSELTKRKQEAKKNDTSDLFSGLDGAFSDISSGAGGASKSVDTLTESVNRLGEAFEPVAKKSKVSLKNLSNNLVSNYKEQVRWAADFRTLMTKGFDESIIQWIQDMGVAGHETVKAFMNASNEEVVFLNAMTRANLSLDEMTSNIIAGSYGDAGTAAIMAFSEAIQSYDTELAETIQSAVDPFAKFNSEVKLSGAEMLVNMQSQLDGIRKWTDNLATLIGRGVDEGIIEHFKELGPASYEEVSAMANMTDAQLAQANDLWNQQMNLGVEGAMKIAGKYAEVGGYITEGFINGIDLQSAAAIMSQFGDAGVAALRGVWGIASPSKETYSDAQWVVLGFRNGLQQNSGQVTAKITSLGAIWTSKFKTVGTNMMGGIRDGIYAGKSEVINAAVNVATAAYEAAKAALDINSPSKKFREIGLSTDEGFAQGIDRGSYWVTDSIDNLGVSAIDRMSEVVKKISDNINGDFEDISPVISPRLDLEGIQNGRSLIDRMFGGTGYKISESILSDQQQSNVNQIPTNNGETTPTNNQTIIFNQTNNSPKNIDPYESYRLNRLAAEQLKGAFV